MKLNELFADINPIIKKLKDEYHITASLKEKGESEFIEFDDVQIEIDHSDDEHLDVVVREDGKLKWTFKAQNYKDVYKQLVQKHVF